jgi:hypothetical protein
MSEDNTYQPWIRELDRLGAELEQAKAREAVSPEELRRRHGQAVLEVLLGPNCGAMGQKAI